MVTVNSITGFKVDKSMAQRRIIDTTRVIISAGRPTGRGTGLGKVEQKPWTLKKLREKFAEPLVDVNTPVSQYFKLSKIAKDLDHPKHKEAADKILVMKQSAGNWTAARYTGKSRKASDLVAKTMLVLDIDHANPDQVLDIRANLTPCAEFYWLAHTSRSHAPEKPKFRMAFAISREVTPDEGHACLRLLSTYLLDDPEESIELVDLVTFRPNQTMFWPSVSKGQEYWHDENLPGRILDVDEFLSRHPGWENFENLPYQTGEKKAGLKDPAVKMENPHKKPEPIGAFCRVYSIEDAIETFLPDIYEPSPSASDVRYTYVPGSANNGAVVYDDGLFLLSMHGSDPAAGMHNAFDLVRLHKFGDLDTDSHGNTAPGNMPSFKAMVKLCREDEAVIIEEMGKYGDMLDDYDDEDEDSEHTDTPTSKKTGKRDTTDDPLGDELDDLPEDDPEIDALLGVERPKKSKTKKDKADMAWLTQLRRKANGELEPQASINADLLCKHHPLLRGKIAFNQFTQDPVILAPIRSKHVNLPSDPVNPRDRKHGRRVNDDDDTSIKILLSAKPEQGGFAVDFSKDNSQAAVVSAAKEHQLHPIRDFLKECHETWEAAGSPRGELERLAIDFLGCPDTPFHRESALIFLVAAVARIEEPGCKMDQMTIIEGPTGSRKSTFWQVLFNGFCTELKVDLHDTGRLIEAMRGWWALEMAEMQAAKRADSNTLKMQLSSSGDQHRLAYARRPIYWLRQNVFCGTSNENDYLTDPTSNRRYYVWRTKKTRFDPIETDRLQERLPLLWGEAVQVYRVMREKQPQGDLWLDLRSKEAVREQEEIAEGSRKRTAVEEIAEIIAEWLDTPVPAETALVDRDGMTLDGYEGDDTPMLRNMVTAKDAYEALAHDTRLRAYRNADVRTFGKAMAKVEGWREIGKVRRHGSGQIVWFCRLEDGPLWIPTPEGDQEVDDLLS